MLALCRVIGFPLTVCNGTYVATVYEKSPVPFHSVPCGMLRDTAPTQVVYGDMRWDAGEYAVLRPVFYV